MISILLASYNGEKFIAEQIESLLSQTVSDFKLYIYDDRSTDSTFSIVQGYAEKYENKISVKQNPKNTGGSKYNFMKMMTEHRDDYVMLCDQDDVWLPDKIEKSLKRILEMEILYGKDTPILVHTDLKVTDSGLKIISDSYFGSMDYSFIDPPLNYLLVQNTVAGCTVMYNRALADLLFAEPRYFFMHDWWLALAAVSCGKLGTICEPLILYRQHENNNIGAKRKSFISKLSNIGGVADTINNTYKQADCLLNIYHDKLTEENTRLLSDFSSVPSLPKIQRLKVFFKYRTFKTGVWRKVSQLLMIFLMK